MNRVEFEEYLGKRVSLKLFDNTLCEGFLRRTGDECFKNNPNLYIPRNKYDLVDENFNSLSCIFRVSHIKKIRCLY